MPSDPYLTPPLQTVTPTTCPTSPDLLVLVCFRMGDAVSYCNQMGRLFTTLCAHIQINRRGGGMSLFKLRPGHKCKSWSNLLWWRKNKWMTLEFLTQSLISSGLDKHHYLWLIMKSAFSDPNLFFSVWKNASAVKMCLFWFWHGLVVDCIKSDDLGLISF